MAGAAAGRVGRMDGADEQVRPAEAAAARAVDARTVERIDVAEAAVIRSRNVTRRLRDDDDSVMRPAVMTAGAVAGDPGGKMIESRQRKGDESRAVALQTVLSRQWLRYVRRRLAGGTRTVVTGPAGRRRHVADDQ